jgi:hypothetical protein
METLKKKITTNSRVVKEHLTNYRDTFQALIELINNSIQANAKNINIDIDYTGTSMVKSPVNSIEISDDGHGVSISDFPEKILQIGTTSKTNGKGIGRFGALQLGEEMVISTIGFDKKENKFIRTFFNLNSSVLNNSQFSDIDFNIDYEPIEGKVSTMYSVKINSLFHNKQEKILKKNKLTESFLKQNINQSIFEYYPNEIFNNLVNFKVNGAPLDKKDFVIGKPTTLKKVFLDRKQDEHEISFYFYQIKSEMNKVKIFFQVDNSGIKSIAHEFTYFSDWYTEELGTWFIYIDSPLTIVDLFRNFDIERLGENQVTEFKNFVKQTINEFFKAKNKRFEKFINSLESDIYYPYKDGKLPTSKSHEIIFKKVAYLIEDEHKLIQKNNKLRDFIYHLLNQSISNGQIIDIFDKVLKLNNVSIEKFHNLLEKTDLEDVIHFSSQVADKLKFLDFFHHLVYGEISKVLKERSQLHKILEKNLWLFGENYNGDINIWSDRRIGGILEDLRKQFLIYEPTIDDDNIIEHEDVGLNDITDLFFFHEKILDNESREIMVVELKSPKCSIGMKEINQIDRYALTIESTPSFPTENVKYKLYLTSSKLNNFAKSKMDSAKEKYGIPFLYDIKTKKNIEIYIMEWSELIELNKRKLGYLSSKLNIKDEDVKDVFEIEYPELIDEKINAQLRKVS